MNKNEVLKLNPGAVLKLKWKDGSFTNAFLLEKPEPNKGDINLYCFHENGIVDRRTVHKQVEAILDNTGLLKILLD